MSGLGYISTKGLTIPRYATVGLDSRKTFSPVLIQHLLSICWVFEAGTTALCNDDSYHFLSVRRVGRRPVLLCSIIFILIFGLTVALSVNVTMFSTLRFFEGFCLAGIILTLYALRK